MGVKIAPDARRQFINASGVPYSGAKLFYYGAGSTTKQSTYTTSAGGVANSNPIILDSAGRTPYGVWFTEGLSYKEVLAPSNDIDPPSSPIYTEDNLSGVNDTVVSVSQWEASQLTPTYVSSTSFTVPGDQTSELHVGRRLELSVTAGTVYGRISASVYGALTTVTVAMDSGQALDSGLSSLNWSILTATNHAIPKLTGALWDGVGVVNTDSTQTVAGNKTFSGANVHSGGDTFSGPVTATSTVDLSGAVLQGATPLVFEGTLPDNAFETSLVITNPTADRTLTVPDANVDLTNVRAATEALTGYGQVASAAVVTTGTNTTQWVPPAYLPFHPFMPKAWVTFNGTAGVGAISPLASAGITSVSKSATGIYTITFNFTFANANYAPSFFVQDDNASGGCILSRNAADTKTTTAVTVRCIESTGGALVDSAYISIVFHGER